MDIPDGWTSSVTEYAQLLVYGHVESDETFGVVIRYHFNVIMVKEW